jgi:GDP-D-mannose dehydratase
VGKDKSTGVVRVRIDSDYYRPTEVQELLGDARLARELLGWDATTMTSFEVLRLRRMQFML